MTELRELCAANGITLMHDARVKNGDVLFSREIKVAIVGDEVSPENVAYMDKVLNQEAGGTA